VDGWLRRSRRRIAASSVAILTAWSALVRDRDRHAARNIAKLAESSSEGQNTCGAGGAGWGECTPVQLPVLT